MKRKLHQLLDRLPYLRSLRAQVERQGLFPAGHYYSPIPAQEDVAAYLRSREGKAPSLPGIELNAEEQRARLDEYRTFHAELPFPEHPHSGSRYHYENDWFSYGDAIFLYGFLRKHRPARIIEVGSGFSTAAMLDTCDALAGYRPELSCIEPHPERLQSLLRDGDQKRVNLVAQRVQDVPPELFTRLGAGDLLFVDSSHVVKAGSDLQLLLFDVLPRLAPGCFVHFHDVFYPFEYPPSWLREGRYWNENYFLRAFLSWNREWRICFFNSYVATVYGDVIARQLPLCARNPGGGLYLQRAAADAP
jgi:predicted O-methyltransferase YrrM